MADGFLLVFSNPVAGQDDEFNEWYDTSHIPDVLDVPGVAAAQRYELAPMQMPKSDDVPEAQIPEPAHRYLAIYELDEKPDDVMNNFLDRVVSGRMPMSETLDMATLSVSAWTPRGGRQVVVE